MLLAALGVALAGCASKPPPAPAPVVNAGSSAASSKSAPAPRSSSAARPGRSAPAPAANDVPLAKAERNFVRPARGPVLQAFDGRNNKGIDFGGVQGDPVYAARDGQVVYAADGLRGYGRMIMIKHDATYLTAYAHNSQLLVKTGDRVKRGQLIARMGSTESDRVKLHFELRRGGNAVNPLPYFMAEGGGADPG